MTSDGTPSCYGLYYATLRDKAKIRAALAGIAAANDEKTQKTPPHGQG